MRASIRGPTRTYGTGKYAETSTSVEVPAGVNNRTAKVDDVVDFMTSVKYKFGLSYIKPGLYIL